MRVASHLKVPVSELKCRITFTEFLSWLEFLELEEEKDTKLHYYLAQIASLIVQVNSKKRIRLQDFLIKYARQKSPEERTQSSKEAWASALGIDLTKRKKRKRDAG